AQEGAEELEVLEAAEVLSGKGRRVHGHNSGGRAGREPSQPQGQGSRECTAPSATFEPNAIGGWSRFWLVTTPAAPARFGGDEGDRRRWAGIRSGHGRWGWLRLGDRP